MSNILSATEVQERALIGTRWLILTNAISIPSAYMITVVLGRTGPSVLGAFALAQISIGVIMTFIMLGGPVVLRNFIPKVSHAKLRGRFVLSYGIILSVLVAFALLLFRIFPSLLEFLLHQKFSMNNYLWFTALTVVVVASECLIGTVTGLMHFKTAAIVRSLKYVMILLLVSIFFWGQRVFLSRYGLEIVLSGFFAAFVFSIIICIAQIKKDNQFKMDWGWYLPSGFTAFSTTSSAAMVFTFIYTNFDRICVLGLQDMKGLGKYQAVISLTMLVEYIPKLMQAIFVPVFSSFLATNEHHLLKRAYAFIYRSSVLVMTLAAIVVVSFSREMLNIFGEGYSTYYYLLCFFAFVNVVRSPAFLSVAILTSYEKNSFRITLSIFQLGLQMGITIAYISKYGILAIAGAKIVGVLVASSIGHIYVIYRMKMAPRLPWVFKMAIAVASATVVLRIWVVPTGWLWSLALMTVSAVVFAALCQLTMIEIYAAAKTLITGKSDNLRQYINNRDL
jgi:O-antigen/teichoic acid export membrane protein